MLTTASFVWILLTSFHLDVQSYSKLIKIGALERSASSSLKLNDTVINYVKHTAKWGDDIGVDIIWSLLHRENCFSVIQEAKRLSKITDLLIFADEFSNCVGHGLNQHDVNVPVLFYKGRQSVSSEPKKGSSVFAGYLMCGFTDIQENLENIENCEIDLDDPISEEPQITISKVETMAAVVKKLEWKHTFVFYEGDTEKEAKVLTDTLSLSSIHILMYNLDTFNDTRQLQELLTSNTILEKGTSNFIVLNSIDTAKALLTIADNLDKERGHKEASFSMISNWLVILPDENKSFIENCVTDLDHVAVIIYPPSNYVFIHEMMKGLPLSIEEILRKVGDFNYTERIQFEVLQNETINLFIKYFTNPLLCWHSDIYTLMRKPDGRRLNHVGFVDVTGELSLDHKIFPNLDFGLNRRKFTVSTLPWHPFITNTTPFDGFCMDILEELSYSLNFTYEITDGPADKEWGMLVNRTWTGLIGQLQNETVDLVAGPLMVTPDREYVMDFTFPFYQDALSVLIKKPDPSSTKWRTMIEPFHSEVLMCIGLSLLGSSVILFLLEKWNPFYSQEPYLQRYAGTHIFQDAFWYMYGAMLTQGGEHLPDSQAGRTMISTWWLFSIIMAATYSGNLIAFLTVTKDKPPFETLSELISDSDYRWGLPSGTKIRMEVEYSSNDVLKRVWNTIAVDALYDPRVLSIDKDVHIDLVKGGYYAFIADKSSLKIPMLTDCDLYLLKETFTPLQYGFGLQNRSAYTEMFSKEMLSIYESGLLQIWQRRWWNATPFCKGELQTVSKPISLVDVQSSFFLIGIGIVVAAIALGFEHFFLKYCSRQKQQPCVTTKASENLQNGEVHNHRHQNGCIKPEANGHVGQNGHITQDENDNISSDDGDLGLSFRSEFTYF
ncbi:glutamate receptor ionotropic, kainate 4 [Patella vulgata]|uniref:glutamate receptor ionotropic, kainate 4 n=1 Tax=Patella vulgata TaxID=6465 RepID=UPI00217F290B|nr:glutamate receptor ionotropic, kainate 4 [Patella vulgata]XP_050405394.1 glutamate receptor ionotropic, kainate 4 [Patella vulgata]